MFAKKTVEVNAPNGLRTRVNAFHCLFLFYTGYQIVRFFPSMVYKKLWYRLHSSKSCLTDLSNEIKTAS